MNIYYAYKADLIANVLDGISCLECISKNRRYKLKDSNYMLVIVYTDRGTIVSPFSGKGNDLSIVSWEDFMSNIPEEAATELLFNLDVLRKYS